MKVWILSTGQSNNCTWCLNSSFENILVFSDETTGRNALKSVEHQRLQRPQGLSWIDPFFTHEGKRILIGDWEKLTEHTICLE
jgi:hypothetical protein